MIFTYQTKLHKIGTRGNCLAACLSSITEIPIEKIPKLEDINGDWAEEMIGWLWDNGFEFESYNDEDQIIKESNNDYYIVGGTSPRNKNINHSVIYKNKNLIHDPHPDNKGIINEPKYLWYIKKINHE